MDTLLNQVKTIINSALKCRWCKTVLNYELMTAADKFNYTLYELCPTCTDEFREIDQ